MKSDPSSMPASGVGNNEPAGERATLKDLIELQPAAPRSNVENSATVERVANASWR